MKLLIEKTVLAVIGVVCFLLAIIIGSSWWWYSANTAPVSNDTTTKEITIEKGLSFAEVAQKLEDEKIIRNAFAFRLWSKFGSDEITVQAGNHRFSPSMTFKEIAGQLELGLQDVNIQIKEGARVEEINEILKDKLEKEYLSTDFLKQAKPLEGMLFPDTYNFYKNSTAESVIKRLNDTFEQNYKSLNGPTDPAEKKRIVILASILEREGLNDKDRPVIAGILENRLKSNTETAGFLQIDATLQYAIGNKHEASNWWSTPTADDKEVDSPYNTYKYKGLPPGPICNPGNSSLSAAIVPQRSNYLYYIHDNQGNAYYAKTFEEHDRNIAKYLN